MTHAADTGNRIVRDRIGDFLMRAIWWKPPTTVAERTRRRVVVHLIPVLFGLYILAYLDRFNVGVAKLGMTRSVEEQGLGFSNSVIGLGISMFFYGYWILEIPGTLSVLRWGARWVFCRILILWGICAALIGLIGLPAATRMFSWLPHMPENVPGLGYVAQFVNGLPENPEYQFYFFRFMLGVFEGGFFPSVIVYLSLWFRQADRAKAIATFMAAVPIASMFGNPTSGLLLDVDWFGLPGWRWIYILEGIAPVFAGIAVLFCLPDRPEKARWLSAEERSWLVGELEHERQSKQGHGAWRHHVGMVLLLTLVYFCLNVMYGLHTFMPSIIKSQIHASDFVASCWAGLPYVVALFAMLINGWHSDRTGERIWHVAVPLAAMCFFLALVAICNDVPYLPVAIMICCVGPCLYSFLPAFWPIPTMFLGAGAAASAIGFINMMGNMGGAVGPWMVGKAAESGDYAHALWLLAPWPLMSAAIIVAVGYFRRGKRAQEP